uniref:Uncharacterized protein n=1 Tax=Anguilla anguilla TaxID=7936 RepID=A0A0E9XBP8_ANGAN
MKIEISIRGAGAHTTKRLYYDIFFLIAFLCCTDICCVFLKLFLLKIFFPAFCFVSLI